MATEIIDLNTASSCKHAKQLQNEILFFFLFLIVLQASYMTHFYTYIKMNSDKFFFFYFGLFFFPPIVFNHHHRHHQCKPRQNEMQDRECSLTQSHHWHHHHEMKTSTLNLKFYIQNIKNFFFLQHTNTVAVHESERHWKESSFFSYCVFAVVQ